MLEIHGDFNLYILKFEFENINVFVYNVCVPAYIIHLST